jgi:hypothetical protein
LEPRQSRVGYGAAIMIVRPNHFRFDRQKQRQLDELAVDETLTSDQQELIGELGVDQPFFNDVQSFCFYCSEKLTVPAVAWHGSNGESRGDAVEIWLHPKCAEHLAARIQRDVNELKSGKRSADEQLAAWKRDHPM